MVCITPYLKTAATHKGAYFEEITILTHMYYFLCSDDEYDTEGISVIL
jgi:hypothetical protein